VVLHEKADDFGQPTGNAGGRIGCGTIQLEDHAKADEEKANEEEDEDSAPEAPRQIPAEPQEQK
jgi:hypothetical protein